MVEKKLILEYKYVYGKELIPMLKSMNKEFY
jgi:hypothetical protein